MSPFIRSLLITALLCAAACSTPQSRIEKNRAAFDRFPAEVRQKISTGRVDLGFTEEMVLMALGHPERKFSRVDAEGTSEVWVYYRRQPRYGFGFGMSSGGYHSSVGGGVAVETGGYPDEEALRVVFQDGRVTAIESQK